MNAFNLRSIIGRARLVAVLASLLCVFAVACGDDDEPDNAGINNGGVDAGDVGAGDTGDAGDAGDAGTDGGADADTGGDVEDDTGDCQELGLNAACDPKCQTGCGTDETCVPSRASESDPVDAICSPEGTAGQGEACGQTGCQPGFGCYGTSTDDAVCQEICQPSAGDNACSTPGTTCAAFDSSVDIGRCITPESTCEIFPPEDTCGAGENCYGTQSGGTVCAPFNPDASAGDACSAPNDCNDLQACAGPDANSLTCVDKCDPNAETNRCAEGEQCVAFSNDPNTGACTAPQN